jgi:hypothetical protein
VTNVESRNTDTEIIWDLFLFDQNRRQNVISFPRSFTIKENLCG